MRRLRRAAIGLLVAICFVAAGVTVAALLTDRAGDPRLFPAAGVDAVDVQIVSHGYHSGLVLPRAVLASMAGEAGLPALIDVGARFAAFEAIEVGWGEERFYRQVPTVAALDWRLALSALLQRGNASVLHVVGLANDARTSFPQADIVELKLSRSGLQRLLAVLEETFATGAGGRPVHLGPGLYGPSLFYRAKGEFSVLNVCNHWTARLLSAAGVPTSPIAATLPAGLLLDLRLRSGLTAVPRHLDL